MSGVRFALVALFVVLAVACAPSPSRTGETDPAAALREAAGSAPPVGDGAGAQAAASTTNSATRATRTPLT